VSDFFSVLSLFKPEGLTSHDVVARCRKCFNIKQVGHLGTLDPAATGVLPVALGKATRLIEYFPDDKVYLATIALGTETDTLDAEGQIIAESAVPSLDYDTVWHLLPQFMGTIEQRVPRYSAVHYKGKKLYHYVRSGIIIPDEDLPVKQVSLFDIALLAVDTESSPCTITLKVHCSSGTYMRTLAADLARALGTVGHLLALERLAHGHFAAESSVSLEDLLASPDPYAYLLSPLDFMAQPQLVLPPDAVTSLCNGMMVACPPSSTTIPSNTTVIARSRDRMAAMAIKVGHCLKPLKVLSASLRQPTKPLLPISLAP
jgi:tRNA pseudouridine55 synthase